MRLVAIALAVALAAAAPPLAATNYWAFGDSITRGSADPVDATIVFDKEGSPTGSCPRASCGYGWRLQNSLGAGHLVINRGWGGEETPGGITRIVKPGEPLATSRCTDPNAGDVLLLMEGTNDITNGLSSTSVRDNLAIMLNLATTKCVHGVVASTIRRLLAGTAVGSKTGDPAEPVTSDLAVKISQLATQRNRRYADVWAPLCPDQPCYDSHFWGRMTMNDPGHVDASGYGVMAPVFHAAIIAVPLPGAATTSLPLGDITDDTPTFTWNEHSNADWYFLEVDGGGSYGRWHPEEAICSGGVCSFDPAVPLAPGDHSWRVRTRNLRGVGTWSASKAFCTSPEPRDLTNPGTVNTLLTEVACGTLRALAGYAVGASGNVTFHAGSAVVLGNGFSVETGGTFTARDDY